MDLGATATHEKQLLEQVRQAARTLARSEAQTRRARLARDAAIRRAVAAGVRKARVAEAAEVSDGFVSRVVNAPRPT